MASSIDMETSRFQFVPLIPAEYALAKVDLNWSDIMWAYERGVYGKQALVDFARLKKIEEIEQADLSRLTKDNLWKAEEILPNLIRLEESSDSQACHKWLYIVLSYIYENISDPVKALDKVEEIYTDFNYPKEIEGFVKFMPETDALYNPAAHSSEVNLKKMLTEWKNYLEKSAKKFGAAKATKK
jgi:hypothetical protein